jgi:AraC-like DNA-binding protein
MNVNDLPFLPVVYLNKLVEVMHEEQIQTEHIFKECGINSSVLTKPEAFLSVFQARAIINHYLELTTQPFAGLRYGQRLDLMAHGLFGYVFTARVPFRELMTTILHYLQVRVPLMMLNIRHETNYIAISVSYRHHLQETESFVTQVFLSSMYTLVAMITKNCTLHFESHILSDTRGIEQFISVPVETGHSCNEIRIYAAKQQQSHTSKTEVKHNPLTDHDLVIRIRTYLLSQVGLTVTIDDVAAYFNLTPSILRARLIACGTSFNEIRADLHKHTTSPVMIEKDDDFEDHGLVVRMRAYLLTQVDQPVSAEDAAQHFHMSVRTLRRRLADIGMSFNEIRLEVRMHAAMRYLKTSNLSLARISGVVGYSDQASFTRAFQKWCHETPDVVRKKHRQSTKLRETVSH